MYIFKEEFRRILIIEVYCLRLIFEFVDNVNKGFLVNFNCVWGK